MIEQTPWLDLLAEQWRRQSMLEVVAVISALMYLLLATRQNIWCWAFAALSTLLYIVVFHEVALYSESILNAYYLIMAGYGWYQWRHGGDSQAPLPVQRWSVRQHAVIISLTLAMTYPVGWIMLREGADYPYLDALTSCFAVITTVMVTRKVLENWLYWLIIDALMAWLCVQKGLYLTGVLFALYLPLAAIGYWQWRRAWQAQ